MPQLSDEQRIVITGVGLAAPNADNLQDYRSNLLAGKSGVGEIDLRFIGKVPAGICTFPETKYRKKKENKTTEEKIKKRQNTNEAPGQDAWVCMLPTKPCMTQVLLIFHSTNKKEQVFTSG